MPPGDVPGMSRVATELAPAGAALYRPQQMAQEASGPANWTARKIEEAPDRIGRLRSKVTVAEESTSGAARAEVGQRAMKYQ